MSEKIIEKIRKLNQKASGLVELGSEAEARVFADAVQRMLAEHQLSMTDIQFEERKLAEPVEEGWLDWAAHGIDKKKKRILWQEQLCLAIARAHHCQIFVSSSSNFINLIGRKSDKEVAEYVMVALLKAADSIATKEYYKKWYELRPLNRQGECAGFRASFLMGFVEVMVRRYKDMEAEITKQYGTLAVVRFDDAKLAVKKYVEGKNTKKASQLNWGQNQNRMGADRGREVARNMELRKGVSNSSGSGSKMLGN